MACSAKGAKVCTKAVAMLALVACRSAISADRR